MNSPSAAHNAPMAIDLSLLDGSVVDAEVILRFLRQTLFPAAIARLNSDTLPVEFGLYDCDVVPTNQRNLTDVRTRMGVLLEYELAKAINALLPTAVRAKLSLTYVIANKFPDLAFRGRDGSIGVRFEVKAIQAIAEEKSANFDTLVKDIRRGTDFVIVLVWEWCRSDTCASKYPCVRHCAVLDAYQLAQMRDCYWLNCPPSNVGTARQGFDLCFGVNCRASQFNREEGNYGKLMRIFDRDFEQYLPEDTRRCSTLMSYYKFRDETIRLGLEHIGGEIAAEYCRGELPGVKTISSCGLPVVIVGARKKRKLLIVGDAGMPSVSLVRQWLQREPADYVLALNAKFNWRSRMASGDSLGEGRKPGEAKATVAALD